MCKLYFAVLAHNLLFDLKDTRIGDSQNVLHNQGLEMVTDKRRGRVKLTGNFSKVKVEFRSVMVYITVRSNSISKNNMVITIFIV